ncbi:MAG: glycosyltransferase family 4 protein [Deltaproteobacteria bacterium]|nr:glycosyltransferase family 4 protein [Deltaproteobacteria bacterium]
MRTLILAAGRFGPEHGAAIASGREPRLDVFELARELDATVLDYRAVDAAENPAIRLLARRLGDSPLLAAVGFGRRHEFDAVLTTGEDIGIPLAALLQGSRANVSHTMIAHTLSPAKKRAFFDLLGVERRMDRILAYSTSEERHIVDRLRIPAEKVQRIYFHADTQFFRPDPRPAERDLVCAAGQLLRDYDTLIDAVRGLPVRLEIAAGSPWIAHDLAPSRPLPEGVSWGKRDRHALRELYARAAIAVVPIVENDYQTGIATILEMMAMGKCVVATRTRGQTDTIVDGETGVYVSPGDARALRAAIERLLADPAEAARLGRGARAFVEREATLERFVERVATAVRDGHRARSGR